MKKNVIVSLADSNYFPLLNELIDSIKRFKESSDVAICILDAGLSDDQKTQLSLKVDEIRSAEWDIKVPDSKIKGREWLKSQVSRAFLPKYFPSYSFKKIVIQRKATIFLLFGIVLFVGLLLIYPFNVISISAIIYLGMLPISFFHYQKLKKQNEDQNYKDEDDDLEDIL